jgi:hypothetical protein
MAASKSLFVAAITRISAGTGCFLLRRSTLHAHFVFRENLHPFQLRTTVDSLVIVGQPPPTSNLGNHCIVLEHHCHSQESPTVSLTPVHLLVNRLYTGNLAQSTCLISS